MTVNTYEFRTSLSAPTRVFYCAYIPVFRWVWGVSVVRVVVDASMYWSSDMIQRYSAGWLPLNQVLWMDLAQKKQFFHDRDATLPQVDREHYFEKVRRHQRLKSEMMDDIPLVNTLAIYIGFWSWRRAFSVHAHLRRALVMKSSRVLHYY